MSFRKKETEKIELVAKPAENQENIATAVIADNQVDSMADKGDAGYHGLLNASNFSSPLVDLERHLAYFLGLFNHSQYLGMPPVTEEVNCSAWTKQVGPLNLFFSPFPYESLLIIETFLSKE